MKILYINGFIPREQTPMGGIFVTKRIQALKKKGIQILPYIYGVEYSEMVQKYLERVKHIPRQSKPVDQQIDVRYQLRMVSMGFREMAAAGWYPSVYARKIARQLERDWEAEQGADLIHLHWLWPIGAGVQKFCRERGVPYVITCHGSEINLTMEHPRTRKAMLPILEDAAVVEFVSRALLERAKELGYSGKNAAVVYNGIDGTIFKRETVKAFEEHTKEHTVIGFAGNLITVKGADRLPEIFRRIYEKHPLDVEFRVAGNGELRNSLEERMQGLPVTFIGRLTPEALAKEYKKMDFLVVPSRREGYSCVIKEAQACGVIPIGPQTGGIPEAMSGYGTAVSGTEEEICAKLADAVNAYLEQKCSVNREEMARQAAKADWEMMQNASVQLYHKILEAKDR